MSISFPTELFSSGQPPTPPATSSTFTHVPSFIFPSNNRSCTTSQQSSATTTPLHTASASSPFPDTSAHNSQSGQSSHQHSVHNSHASPNSNHHNTSSLSPNHLHIPSGPIFNPTPITILPPSSSDSPSSSSHSNNVHQSISAESVTSQPSQHVEPHRIHPNNIHSMATRGKHGVVQKRKHPTLLLTHIEPTGYRQAMKQP